MLMVITGAHLTMQPTLTALRKYRKQKTKKETKIS